MTSQVCFSVESQEKCSELATCISAFAKSVDNTQTQRCPNMDEVIIAESSPILTGCNEDQMVPEAAGNNTKYIIALGYGITVMQQKCISSDLCRYDAIMPHRWWRWL